jgi:hypothetical protein
MSMNELLRSRITKEIKAGEDASKQSNIGLLPLTVIAGWKVNGPSFKQK